MAQVGRLHLGSQRLPAALPEHLAGVVLHHAQHIQVQLANHIDAALGVQNRQILRRADHHEPVHRQTLHHRQRRVGSAGRQIHHQIVQFVPVGGLQELVDGVVNHRAAPDDGLFLIFLKERHGHHFDAPFFGGNNLPVHIVGAAGGGQHIGGVGAVDVHIQQPHLRPLPGQGDGQIDGDGGLADAALAAVNADFGLDFVQPLANLAFLLPTALNLFQARVLRVLLGGSHQSSPAGR